MTRRPIARNRTPMEDAVTPLPIPERTPPVTTNIFRLDWMVSWTRSRRDGGR